jgi:hypothetical protein
MARPTNENLPILKTVEEVRNLQLHCGYLMTVFICRGYTPWNDMEG